MSCSSIDTKSPTSILVIIKIIIKKYKQYVEHKMIPNIWTLTTDKQEFIVFKDKLNQKVEDPLLLFMDRVHTSEMS